MKRKAILIDASNVSGQSDLPGARVDIQNWKNFLTSDLGGAWRTGDIVTLQKPTSAALDRELNVDYDCYCFVAFSGHGCNGSVVLNEFLDTFSVAKLRPRSERGTLVVDACRGIEGARSYTFAEKITAVNESSERKVIMNSQGGRATAFEVYGSEAYRVLVLANHRSAWESAFDSSTGIVDMLACSPGQAANEDPNAGGYYTSLLMQSADIWQSSASNATVHTTKEAHDYAARILPPQQRPEYRPAWLAFPFAVKA